MDNKKDLLEELEKPRIKRENFTFRLDSKIVKDFKQMCDSRGMSYSSALEKLIEGYLEGYSKKSK